MLRCKAAQCRTRLAIRPNSARAVLFYSQHPKGVADDASIPNIPMVWQMTLHFMAVALCFKARNGPPTCGLGTRHVKDFSDLPATLTPPMKRSRTRMPQLPNTTKSQQRSATLDVTQHLPMQNSIMIKKRFGEGSRSWS